MSRQLSVTLVLVLMSLPIYGHSTVYKCTTEGGRIIYQQVPCRSEQKQESVPIPSGPSQQDAAAAQARLRAYEQANRKAGNDGRSSDGTTIPQKQSDVAHSEAEYRTNEHSLSNSGPCPPGQVPLNSSKVDPARGWSRSKGYVRLKCGTPDESSTDRAVRTGPGITEPRRIQDQYGNWYTQPPGSSFATDEKTGKQCFVYGNFVECD